MLQSLAPGIDVVDALAQGRGCYTLADIQMAAQVAGVGEAADISIDLHPKYVSAQLPTFSS